MGSFAYGCSSDSSDVDLYGFCIPDKNIIFPHLSGAIPGFGKQPPRFEVWQQHGVKDGSAMGGEGREYDISIYNIVKFFQLVMENNPNMIDALFVPQNCIVFSTPIGQMVREARHKFLHKGSWHKFKGYAYAQLHKLNIKKPEGAKRKESVEKYGFDVKYAYHIVRLIGEVEQILTEGDIDLQRDRERLKAIRRGDWTASDIENFFNEKEKSLEKVYHESKLQYAPDEDAIKALLMQCLEQHFGTLAGAVQLVDPYVAAVQQIAEICRGVRA